MIDTPISLAIVHKHYLVIIQRASQLTLQISKETGWMD